MEHNFIYLALLCLFILVCALIHEVVKMKEDIHELEREVTDIKLEMRGEIKRINGKLAFIKYCREEGAIDDGL